MHYWPKYRLSLTYHFLMHIYLFATTHCKPFIPFFPNKSFWFTEIVRFEGLAGRHVQMDNRAKCAPWRFGAMQCVPRFLNMTILKKKKYFMVRYL